ncbi:hypothetical protein [Mycobacterium conspicuum]|jgi:hypothetical protein|uniref:Uncharacterized protein n=1 Tax=Mycobacterium conspicuum TaxID=44010 RepID=A0A1X1THQ9_9MYCO|nr:hypothetical protein [Mycobacterium conspicuum]ORV44087.1 hypothetical protein AWC00_08050 [Mycobacterium conspicuum]BBZ39406.1 hypothetical protein MCNS_24690 [Mycobacterium conspicuum]
MTYSADHIAGLRAVRSELVASWRSVNELIAEAEGGLDAIDSPVPEATMLDLLAAADAVPVPSGDAPSRWRYDHVAQS